MKKKGMSDLVLNKSNSSYVNSHSGTHRNSVTNRDKEPGSSKMLPEEKMRVPGLNIEIVQK